MPGNPPIAIADVIAAVIARRHEAWGSPLSAPRRVKAGARVGRGGRGWAVLAGSRGVADPRPATTSDPVCQMPGPARTFVRNGLLKLFFWCNSSDGKYRFQTNVFGKTNVFGGQRTGRERPSSRGAPRLLPAASRVGRLAPNRAAASGFEPMSTSKKEFSGFEPMSTSKINITL